MRTLVPQTAAHCLAHVRRFSMCTHQVVCVALALLSMHVSTSTPSHHESVWVFGCAAAFAAAWAYRVHVRHSVILALSIRADREIRPLRAGEYVPGDTLVDYRTGDAGHRTAVVRRCRTVRQ